MRYRYNGGFSTIEIMMVIILSGILATLGVVHYRKMVLLAELEKYAWSVQKNITGLRPVSMKYDKPLKILFKNNSYIIDTYKKLDTIRLPEKIGFASAEEGPSGIPSGDAISSDSGGAGLWKDSLVVSRDAIGSINNGYVLVSAAGLKGITYYIGVKDSLREVEFFKWTGSQWLKY